MRRPLVLPLAFAVCFASVALAAPLPDDGPVRRTLAARCYDCHSGALTEGGLDLEALTGDLSDPAGQATWVRVFDRVTSGEMPPADADPLTAAEKASLTRALSESLTAAHSAGKGTVLRRLNRREYQNTMNDLFGTHLKLEPLLPEDGRSHEFDTVGEALGMSMQQLQTYIEAARLVIDTAVAKSVTPPEVQRWTTSYLETREAEKFLGDVWKKLDDGAVVQFSANVYPSGMLRGSGVRETGRYRVSVVAYAHQSTEPVSFFVGGTSFKPGTDKPVYEFFNAPPDEPTTFTFETEIENDFMLTIEPVGIRDVDRYKRKKNTIDEYTGPGLAVREVTIEGPLRDDFPSRGHKLIFDGLDRREIEPRNPRDKTKSWYKPKFEIVTEDEIGDVTQALVRVASNSFRRPVNASELDGYLRLYRRERASGGSIEDSLLTAVTAIFCSPRFLYLQEPTQGPLDAYALASRLSYFLHRTFPDEELLATAADGSLLDPTVLREQADRLIGDPKFDRFVTDFCESWLNLREMDFTMPDQQLFPEFDPYLRWSMPRETEAFLKELITSNLPVTNLVKSDFAMLNRRLAEHYGIDDVTSADVQKTPLPAGSVRGGLLSQAAVLKVSANGTNTSPVVRGVFVMERILGDPPSPPPPGIPGVEPDIRGAQTLRELLDKHRNVESCSACHKKIDPPGFALEEFNPIGGRRERYRSLGKGDRVNLEVMGRQVRYKLGPDVDSSGELPTGEQFAGFAEFRDALASDPDRLAETLLYKFLTFGCGRELGFSDRTELDEIVHRTRSSRHGVRELLHAAIQSEIFRSK